MNRLLLLFCLIFCTPRMVVAEPVRVMVAANFKDCLTELATQFTANTGHEVLLSNGATGTLFAQISAGAPCHVFFAADTDRPQRLIAAGLAIQESLVTYAIGRLVLWSPLETVAAADIPAALEIAQLTYGQHLAIANPLHAPYGAAAQQALERTGQWRAVLPFLVKGQSAGQAWQFVHTGAARLGFVSLAHVRAAERANPNQNLGQILLIPATLHDPIDQQAVLLKNAPEAAGQFLSYVTGQEATGILLAFGYEVPTP